MSKNQIIEVTGKDGRRETVTVFRIKKQISTHDSGIEYVPTGRVQAQLSNGKPVSENDDGTFSTEEGEIFTPISRQ